MSHEGRKLQFATLHYPIHIPLFGSLGPTLSKEASAADKSCNMRIEGGFVSLEVSREGIKYNALVPLSSFTHMILAPEEKTAPKAK